MAKKWDRTAMRIASASYTGRQGMLDITFENGDHFLLAIESVLPWLSQTPSRGENGRVARSAESARQMPWRQIRIGETRDVLEIPVDGTLIEIPWDRIRAIADPEFRAHLAKQVQQRARRIGRKIRTMRLDAHVTRAALAVKVGMSREMIVKLEQGNVNPETELIQQIAGMLGRRLRDFVGE